MTQTNTASQFSELLEQIGDGVPNSAQYQQMSGMVLDVPEARILGQMDPFRPAYKESAMQLYLSLRGRAEEGYLPPRDEASSPNLPENLWSGLVPWSFRDARMVSEHMFAWGNILRHVNLAEGGSILEYGPGSGQLLLMLARMGYSAFGVDIDNTAMRGIRAQSEHLGLGVETECAQFGFGFEGKKFDCILFYESFHHAFDFDDLLIRLHDRLNPGGRVVLCGEPIVTAPFAGIPYPWGPRLDALSVFCMRRFGWMELGFTHDYFMKIADITGWAVELHDFPACGRAAVYVLEPASVGTKAARLASENAQLAAELKRAREELAAMHGSTSWRVSRPLRAAKELLTKVRGS